MATRFFSISSRKFMLQLFGVGLLAAILHLALSYPTVLHFTDAVPGGMSDGIHAFGHVWLVHHLALQGHGDLAFTNLAFYPSGIVFGIRPLIAYYAVWGSIGNLIHENLILWYNIGLVGSSAFTAVGVYLIALRLTHHPLAALLAAIMFTFSPRRMDVLHGHINYYSTGFMVWIVVFILAGINKRGRFWPWVAVGALWGLQVWQAPDVMVLIGFLWGPLVLWWWWQAWVDHTKGKGAPRYLWAPLISPIMAFLSLLPMVLSALPYRHMRLSSDQFPWPRTYWFEFLYPSPRHALYRPWGKFLEDFLFVPGHNEAFIGFAGLIGIVIFFVAGGYMLKRFRPWLILSILFFLLILGTKASFFGIMDLPMPYSLMIKIPVLKELRIPARFNTLFSLCVALMAAVGWVIYCRRRLPFARLLLGFLLTLALLDGCYAPMEFTKLRNDGRYYPMRLLNEIKQNPDRELSVLVIPLAVPATLSQAQQTIHEHPTYDGFDPRLREEQIEQMSLGPIESLWTLARDPSMKVIEDKMATEGMSTKEFQERLKSLRLRYVLLNRHDNPRAAFHEEVIRRYFPIEREERDGYWTMFVID